MRFLSIFIKTWPLFFHTTFRNWFSSLIKFLRVICIIINYLNDVWWWLFHNLALFHISIHIKYSNFTKSTFLIYRSLAFWNYFFFFSFYFLFMRLIWSASWYLFFILYYNMPFLDLLIIKFFIKLALRIY